MAYAIFCFVIYYFDQPGLLFLIKQGADTFVSKDAFMDQAIK